MTIKKIPPTRKEKKKAGPVQRTIRDVVIIVVAFVVIRLWVVEANVIPSGSMKDTLLVGDYILAEKVIYHFRDPHPGEIVTFIYPYRDMTTGQAVRFFLRNILGESRTGPRLLIKRVVAAPGDVLEFVMGDNRYDSADSRVIGPVPRKYITARAEIIYFSLAPITCAKHGVAPAPTPNGWFCPADGEPMRLGWDFEPVSRWRFDRRVRWSRMGKLVDYLR
jgi:signal peptidase I